MAPAAPQGHSMTIRRLPDVRVVLLCRRLPHDTRVLVMEYIEGPTAGFYDYLPLSAGGAIIDFLGTETTYLFWTHRCGKVWQWRGYRLPPGDLIGLLLEAEGSPSEDE